MKPTLKIIKVYTDNLSDFNFQIQETDKGDQFAFVTGLHHHNIERHVKNVNYLIAPDVCVLGDIFEWNDGEDRSVISYYFEVIDPMKININQLKSVLQVH